MVAGQGHARQAPARMMAYRHPDAFSKIIDVLVENSITYLLGQLAAARTCCRSSTPGRRTAAARIRALVGGAHAAHSIDHSQSHAAGGMLIDNAPRGPPRPAREFARGSTPASVEI